MICKHYPICIGSKKYGKLSISSNLLWLLCASSGIGIATDVDFF